MIQIISQLSLDKNGIYKSTVFISFRIVDYWVEGATKNQSVRSNRMD